MRTGDENTLPLGDAGSSEERRRRQEIGRRLDALGPEYRVSPGQQGRAEELLERQESLTAAERAELQSLMREFDEIMLRRAEAVDVGEV